MEGVPFVGNDACAHNLLSKGRPLIMRLQQLGHTDGRELVRAPRPIEFFPRRFSSGQLRGHPSQRR